MRFDGSLGNMQIASDFRVVTPLKKKIYDLPFPRTDLIEFFFHKNCTWPMWPRSRKWLGNQVLPAHLIRVFASHFAFRRPNPGLRC
jgi:hypothetical protein